MLRSNLRRYTEFSPITNVFSSRSFSVSRQSILSDEQGTDAWNNAKPYTAIPGPTRFQLIKLFMPGGKLYKAPQNELNQYFLDNYGTLARLPGMMGKRDIVFSYDPRHYELIYRTEGNWPIRRGLEAFAYYREKVRPDVFQGMGGLMSDIGVKWEKLRSTVNPVMMRPKTVKSYVSVVDEVTKEFVQKIHSQLDDNQELPSDFKSDLSMWALESIGVIALDKRLGVMHTQRDADTERLLQAIKDFLEYAYDIEWKPSIWRYYKTKHFRKLMSALDDMTNVVQKHVNEAIADMDRIEKEGVQNRNVEESVLQKLLRVDRHYAMLTVFDMLLGGIDTTSSTIANFFYVLAINQEKQAILREEIFKNLPEIDSPFTEDCLNHAPYFKACVKEMFRVQPLITTNLRGAGQNLVINGYQIPKDTEFAMLHAIIYKDDNYFTDSKTFLPERWLRETKGSIPPGPLAHPFAYLPFGFGARSCVGQRFAEMKIQVLAMRLLREYRIEWHHQPMDFEHSFVVSPISPLRFRLIRSSPYYNVD